MAISNPNMLRTLAVDMGDGTSLVDFKRGGTNTFVRVSDVFSNSASVVGASGNDWAMVMEKAYAYFRTGANTYASLNNGNSGTVMSDFGLSHSSLTPSSTADLTLYNTIAAKLAASKIVTASTSSSATSLIANHAYSVYSVSTDSSGALWITLRNPWGFDGTGSDSNPNDGLVTISLATLKANVLWMDYQV